MTAGKNYISLYKMVRGSGNYPNIFNYFICAISPSIFGSVKYISKKRSTKLKVRLLRGKSTDLIC